MCTYLLKDTALVAGCDLKVGVVPVSAITVSPSMMRGVAALQRSDRISEGAQLKWWFQLPRVRAVAAAEASSRLLRLLPGRAGQDAPSAPATAEAGRGGFNTRATSLQPSSDLGISACRGMHDIGAAASDPMTGAVAAAAATAWWLQCTARKALIPFAKVPHNSIECRIKHDT